MNSSKLIISIVCAVIFINTLMQAQDVFSFVSGKQMPSTGTGDFLHQYDYWIKPLSTTQTVSLQIFDAGLGGMADIVIGNANTKTTFELYSYDSLKTEQSLQVLTTGNEQKYINRWHMIAMLDPAVSPDGWILRVVSGEGDDANAFKLNLIDNEGKSAVGERWMIYSYELPLCLFGISDNEEVQIRPHTSYAADQPMLQSFGEEISLVLLRDIFGRSARLQASKDFLQSPIANINNQWGLSITGSAMRINNLVVRSKSDTAIIWEWMPTIVQKPKPPVIKIVQQAGVNCNSVRLLLSELTRREISDVSPIWLFDDNCVGGDSALIEFQKSGTYSAQVLIPTTGLYYPKYWLSSFTVQVNAPPVAVITGAVEIVSPDEVLTLSAKESHDPEGNPLIMKWFVNSEFRANQPTLKFSSLIPGKYDVKLIVNDGVANSICNEAVDSKIIRVNAQPYVEISGPRIHGRSIETKFMVKNEFDNDGDELLLKWSGTGIVGPKTDKSIMLKNETAGEYSITLTIDDQTGTTNSKYSTKINYRVNADPVPAFELPKQSAPGDEVLLSATNTMDPDDTTLTFHWSVSDGSELDSPEATLSFDAPGDYLVILTVDDGEGVENSVQTYERPIHINAPPIPVIRAVDHSTSARQLFSAEDSHDGDQEVLKYNWDFGDGGIATGKTSTHVFQKSGSYTITLTADDGQNQTNSVQSITHLLVINKYPVAVISIPAKWEPNMQLNVDGTKSQDPDGEITKYTWLLNGKEISTDSIGSIIFPEPGDYAVALKVTDNSGFDDAIGIKTASIHINYPPVIKLKKTPEVSEPNEKVIFDAKGTYDPDGKIKSVTWSFSDGTTLSGMQITKIFKNSGVNSVKITADDGAGFSNSIQSRDFTIQVNNSPIIVTKTFIRSNSQVVLLDASQSYDIDGQALKFDWLLSNGTHRHEASFTWETPKGGVHFLTLTVDDGQGKKNSIAHESIRLIINRPPVAIVDSIIYSCTGMTILLTSSLSNDPDGDPITTQWEFGDGTSSTETNPAHIYSKPGFYTVRLLLSDGFAEKPTVATIPVIIEGSPQALQSFKDTTVCVNASLTFDGTSSTDPNGPLGSYSWDFGDGISALGDNVTHAYSKPGTYYSTLTVMGSGSGRCSKVSQMTSTVKVVEGPTAEFTLPEAVSINEEVNVDASASRTDGKLLSALWEAQSDDIIIGKAGVQVQFKFDTPGLYAVKLSITIETSTNCNSSSVIKNIRVNAPPVMVWNIPKDIALGDLLVLDGSKSYDPDGVLMEFYWTLDGRKVGNTPVVALPMTTAGDHTASLRITDNSGTSTNSITQTMTIRVNSKPDPMFTLPDPIYEGESVKLESSRLTDSDNDTLNFIWKIDGSSYTSNIITFTPGKHTIILIANDGHGLSNSIDSIQKDIFVLSKPDLKSIDFPKDCLINATVTISEITSFTSVGFLINQILEKMWLAQTTGEQTITIGWALKGEILAKENYVTTVWPLLKFATTPEPITITWNPSNPSIVLTAPDVNRPESRKVQYEWRKGQTLIGHGKVIEARLNAGRNIFTIRAIDQDIFGMRQAEVEIVVICE